MGMWLGLLGVGLVHFDGLGVCLAGDWAKDVF